MNKLLTVLFVLCAGIVQAQTWEMQNGAWISPLSKNLGVQKGLQVGDVVGNDTFQVVNPTGRLFMDTNFFQYQVYKGTIQYQLLMTQDGEISIEKIDSATDEAQVINITETGMRLQWTENDSIWLSGITEGNGRRVGHFIHDENGDLVISSVVHPTIGYTVKMGAANLDRLHIYPGEGHINYLSDTTVFENFSGDTVLRMLDDALYFHTLTQGGGDRVLTQDAATKRVYYSTFSSGFATVDTTVDYNDSVTVTTEKDIAINGSGIGVTLITLTTGSFSQGDIVIVSDVNNKAAANNIVIDAGTGNVISGISSAQTYTITADGTSVTLRKVLHDTWKIF